MDKSNSPITFGKLLIENSEAMDKYLSLPRNFQEQILYTFDSISSRQEMESFIAHINNL